MSSYLWYRLSLSVTRRTSKSKMSVEGIIVWLGCLLFLTAINYNVLSDTYKKLETFKSLEWDHGLAFY